MDANANVAEQLRLARQILADHMPYGGVFMPGTRVATLYNTMMNAEALARLVLRLHELLACGGMLPDAWRTAVHPPAPAPGTPDELAVLVVGYGYGREVISGPAPLSQMRAEKGARYFHRDDVQVMSLEEAKRLRIVGDRPPEKS